MIQFLVHLVYMERFRQWGTAGHGMPTLEQVYPEGLQAPERTHTGAWEKHEEQGAAEENCYE